MALVVRTVDELSEKSGAGVAGGKLTVIANILLYTRDILGLRGGQNDRLH
jgi:hypothetical protein